MKSILKYAYEYRNPQGLKMLLAGTDSQSTEELLVSNLDTFSGYKEKQYNCLTGTYQTLSEWINWFIRNRRGIKV